MILATCNNQAKPVTRNPQLTTHNPQPATRNSQPATCNSQPATLPQVLRKKSTFSDKFCNATCFLSSLK